MNTRYVTFLLAGAALTGCAGEGASPVSDFDPRPEVDIATTSESIARANLDHIIDAEEAAYLERPTAERAERIVGARLTRAQFYGTYSDFDRAVELVEAHPERVTLLAQVQSTLHLFAEARAIYGALEPAPTLDLAAVSVALGAHAEVVDQLETAASDRPGFRTHLLAGAAVSADGRFVAADDHFVSALSTYRDASPFPVAGTRFQRGVMWAEVAGDDALGRRMYERALDALPGYITANVHLAELEWSAGDADAAIARLQAVLLTTEDPEPFGLLAEILAERSESAASAALIEEADRRYTSLLERFPEAFWDHASEFYAGPGGDPERALGYAEANLANRPTERAHLLVILSAEAAGQMDRACEVAVTLERDAIVTAELAEWIDASPCL